MCFFCSSNPLGCFDVDIETAGEGDFGVSPDPYRTSGTYEATGVKVW